MSVGVTDNTVGEKQVRGVSGVEKQVFIIFAFCARNGLDLRRPVSWLYYVEREGEREKKKGSLDTRT